MQSHTILHLVDSYIVSVCKYTSPMDGMAILKKNNQLFLYSCWNYCDFPQAGQPQANRVNLNLIRAVHQASSSPSVDSSTPSLRYCKLNLPRRFRNNISTPRWPSIEGGYVGCHPRRNDNPPAIAASSEMTFSSFLFGNFWKCANDFQ